MSQGSLKASKREKREEEALLALVQLYIQTAQAVGSNTLQNNGFSKVSSATIRNYFVSLEEQSYLQQAHSSGGRIPTAKAYRLYAQKKIHEEKEYTPFETPDFEHSPRSDLHSFLEEACERLSSLSSCASFFSSPRFDQDHISKVRLLRIDIHRYLCVIVTRFGLLETETLHSKKTLSDELLQQMEEYFAARLQGKRVNIQLEMEDKRIAHRFYNEIMLRYITQYSHAKRGKSFLKGFSQLLKYQEFNQMEELIKSFSLFEDERALHKLENAIIKSSKLCCWIGDELRPFNTSIQGCSVIGIPYYLNQKAVGALGILGPSRIDYPQLFSLLRSLSQHVSKQLTQSIQHFQLQFRVSPSLHASPSLFLLSQKIKQQQGSL